VTSTFHYKVLFVSSPRTSFARAIWDDDAERVREFLNNGEPVDQREQNGMTPLMHAVHKQAARAVKLLLDHGADPNRVEHTGQLVPLLMAAADADPTMTRLLLEHASGPRQAEAPAARTPTDAGPRAPATAHQSRP